MDFLNKKTKRGNFNDKMHPDNKYYNNAPDFNKLSRIYPDFAKFVFKNKYGGYSIDWKDKLAAKSLIKTLLKEDFNISYWDIPDGFLIPSITSRLNYIHWVNDLLKEYKLDQIDKINGLDIGTGANLIYPLLGNKIYNWRFKATDINQESFDVASKIVKMNKIDSISINLVMQPNENCIFDNVIGNKDFFLFCMCNPPYFSLEEEIKHDNPNTVCEYNEKEVYCKGGEFEFIKLMIKDGEKYRKNIVWFTTLVGKKANLDKIKKILIEKEDVSMVRDTTFYQGKLARWGIAWTYFKNDELNSVNCSTGNLFEEQVINDKVGIKIKSRFNHRKNKQNKCSIVCGNHKIIKEI